MAGPRAGADGGPGSPGPAGLARVGLSTAFVLHFTPHGARLRESQEDRDGASGRPFPAWRAINLVSPRLLVLLPPPPWHRPTPERT